MKEEQIHLKAVKNASDLSSEWNKMGTEKGEKMRNIVTIINTHGNHQILGFGKNEEFNSNDISNLNEKRVDNLILYGCNSGHLDWRESNPASQFVKKVEGGNVLASDGTNYSGNRILNLFGSIEYNSKNVEHFENKVIKVNGNIRDNEGWILYNHIESKTNTTESLGKKLTLTEVLLKMN